MQSDKFIQSHVYSSKHGEFFISTCYRQSSAMLNPDNWYYETLAWKWVNSARTDWVAANGGAITKTGAYKQHIEVCRQLEANGKHDPPN